MTPSLLNVILESMSGSERNPHPIQLLVNYWEIRPALMGARLDDLLRRGIRDVATFIPWQAVEADISHTLARFLQALADRKMTVSLILTPEVGVHYANSGLPKDIFSKPENMARHYDNGLLPVQMPPNSFALPSLFSSEFNKRYHSFLSRMDHFLADLGRRSTTGVLDGVSVVLTGGFWKYYRAPHSCAASSFGGLVGDYSASAALAYRQCLNSFYGQREFLEPSPAAANRWKTRAFEDVNRRWFYQQSEDVFRNRSSQFVRRKALPVRAEQIELFTPEADPGFAYSNLLQMIAGGRADFARLSKLIDDAATRAGMNNESTLPSFIHWTGLGGFRTLSDSEKQFLILKSLLLMGGHGGGLLIDESEWFALSAGFRARAESLARSITQGDLQLKTRAIYLSLHLWSPGGPLWDELNKRIGPNARLVASLELVQRDQEADLLVVDPSYILNREAVQKIIAWVRSGRVAVLPRSPLYTEAARLELEAVCQGTKKMHIDLGVPYTLHGLGDGKLVVYELPERATSSGPNHSMLTFMTAVLAIAGIQGVCSVSDGRLSAIPLQKKTGGMGLFILNGTGHAVSADLIFPFEVTVSDLAVSLSTETSADPISSVAPASRFALEVPPSGILPLAVAGDGFVIEEERRAAIRTGESVRINAMGAAHSELPGFKSVDSDAGNGDNAEVTWS